MGEEQQKQDQWRPEKRTMRFPLRRRDERGGWVPAGSDFELEVWEPSPEQLTSVQAGLAKAVEDAEDNAVVEALGDLVESLILAQATDPAQARRLKKRLWDGRVSTVDAVHAITDMVMPEGATEPNREDRRASLKATRKPQQDRKGGGGRGRGK